MSFPHTVSSPYIDMKVRTLQRPSPVSQEEIATTRTSMAKSPTIASKGAPIDQKTPPLHSLLSSAESE